MISKTDVFEACLQLVHERLDNLKSTLDQKQEGLGNETKSSAGDKYETGRAMLHLEIEKLKSQQAEWLEMLKKLNSLDLSEKNQVEEGALIKTNDQMFFLAVGLGKVLLGNQAVFCLSPDSPLGIEFRKSKKTSFVFRGKTFLIQELA